MSIKDEEAKKIDGVVEVTMNIASGESIKPLRNGKGRFAYVVDTGMSRQEAEMKEEEAIKK